MAGVLEHAEPAAGGPGAAPEGIGLDTERMRGAIAQRLFDAPAATPKIGRFVVIDTIGRGAMGTVVSAWDPQLDRRVAVKVLHGPPSDLDREQLLEEAKALARLNHPNVVTVHEAGLSDGRVYMAMEFVEGGTLREACEAIPIARRGRDRRVHAMFVDAARGLAAAHRVGLVHRDVKPTNMLIDVDGRLRLADFGLARAEVPITREGEADVELATTAGEHTAAAVARDRTGWVGTPAYMAPEQFDGRADERSDQFNLCASFWEIVYGRPPYAGSTLSETCGNVIDGRLQPASPASAVPPWLRRVLLRGIAVAPEDRFVDVATLLRALEVGRSMRHRRRWLAAIVVGSVGVALAAFVGSRGEEDVTARCTAEAETRAPSFDDEQRARLAEAFRATGAAFAPAAWTKVSLQLDGWHARWREADVQACRAQTDPDGETARKAAHQRRCLDRAAIAFASLTEALVEADTTTVPRASMAVHALPEPERCTEAGVERVLVDASPRLAAAAAELARAVTDRNLRRVDSAQRRLETVLESLTADADAAVRTYVHHELGAIANWRREDDAVLSFMRAALADAELSGDIEAQIDAWRVMSFAHARKAEPQAADFAIERMDSLARRAEVSVPTRARAEWGAASTLVELKRFDAAQPRFERALQAYERDIHTPMQIASLRCDYSEALFVQEHIDRATEQVRACREAQIEGLGPSHPYVAVASLQLSQYLFWAGDFQGAIEASDAARAILDENPRFSPSHRAFSYKLRGAANQRLGRHHEALADQQTALDLATEEQGPDSVDAVLARSDMSLTLGSLDRRDDARKMLEAAIESASRNPAVRDSAKATPRLNLASLLAEGGEHEAALEHLRHAREILDDVRPPSSSLSPSYWLTVAQVYRHCERFTEAREAMDRALASIETARVDEARRGAVLAEDARLLDAVGDTARAAARIDEARDLLHAAGSPGKDALAQLDAWARERAGAPEPSR